MRSRTEVLMQASIQSRPMFTRGCITLPAQREGRREGEERGEEGGEEGGEERGEEEAANTVSRTFETCISMSCWVQPVIFSGADKMAPSTSTTDSR